MIRAKRLLLSGFLLGAGCLAWRYKTPEPLVPAPALPATPSSLPRFQLGINEALAIPMRQIKAERPGPEAMLQLLSQDVVETQKLGASIVRGHTGNFPFVSWWALEEDPSRLVQLDIWVRLLQEAQITPVAMLSPWPGNQTGNYTEHYIPEDMASYQAYVSRLVERYDGDGVEDMPGLLRPVLYWEIDNEPDLKHTNLPRDAVRKYDPATFCTPKDYAEVLVASAKAARQASPAIEILIGGFYRPAAESTWRYLDELLAQPEVKESFDILSLHTYFDDPYADRLVAGIQAARSRIPDKPVWITEVSVPSAGDNPHLSEDYQAELLVRTVARAAAQGATALFWHSFADPPDGPNNRHYGLQSTDTTGKHQLKPSGEVFIQLSHVLEQHDLNGAVELEDRSGIQLNDGSILLHTGTRAVSKGWINLKTGGYEEGATAIAPALILPEL